MMRRESHLTEEEKAQHPRLRRQTSKYLRKKRIVRDVWLVSGVLMISMPLNIILALALGTTFLAFTILDETP